MVELLRRNPEIVTDIRARNLEMAWAHRVTERTWRAKTVAWERDPQTGQVVRIIESVTGMTAPTRPYTVVYDIASDTAHCSCDAGRAAYACWHAGVVLLKRRELRRTRLG